MVVKPLMYSPGPPAAAPPSPALCSCWELGWPEYWASAGAASQTDKTRRLRRPMRFTKSGDCLLRQLSSSAKLRSAQTERVRAGIPHTSHCTGAEVAPGRAPLAGASWRRERIWRGAPTRDSCGGRQGDERRGSGLIGEARPRRPTLEVANLQRVPGPRPLCIPYCLLAKRGRGAGSNCPTRLS